MLRLIPAGLIGFRFLIGPLLFAGARGGMSGIWIAMGLLAAVLSDIFDGVIARRLGVATAKLREADSWVDFWLCLWVAISVWKVHRQAIVSVAPLIGLWLATNVIALSFDWLKYRRFACYHAYTAKLAGLLLFVATFALFAIGSDHILLSIALVMAIVSDIERITITAIMPVWTPDIKSFRMAVRLRATLL